MTLHYYSPQADEYCWNKLHLPHESSFRNWLNNIECKISLIMFRKWSFDFSLVINSITPCKMTIYKPASGSYEGFCNYAGIIGEESKMITNEALVFLLVPLRGSYSVSSGVLFGRRSKQQCSDTIRESSFKVDG